MRTQLIIGLALLAMSVLGHAAEQSLDVKVRAYMDDPTRSDESKQIIRKVIDTVRVANGLACTGKSGLDAEIRAFMDDPTRSEASKRLVRMVVGELRLSLRSAVADFAPGSIMKWYLQHRAAPVIEGCSCKSRLPTDGCSALG
jgi:hypothetical protein